MLFASADATFSDEARAFSHYLGIKASVYHKHSFRGQGLSSCLRARGVFTCPSSGVSTFTDVEHATKGVDIAVMVGARSAP